MNLPEELEPPVWMIDHWQLEKWRRLTVELSIHGLWTHDIRELYEAACMAECKLMELLRQGKAIDAQAELARALTGQVVNAIFKAAPNVPADLWRPRQHH